MTFKRILAKSLAAVASLVLLLVLAIIVLRDVSPGAYLGEGHVGDDSKVWAEVDGVVPRLRIYGGHGVSGPSLLLVPVAGVAIPLGRHWPLMHYEPDGDDVRLIPRGEAHSATVAFRRLAAGEAETLRRTWDADHAALQTSLQELAQAAVTPAWRTPLYGGLFTLSVPEGYSISFTPSNTGYPAARLLPAGEPRVETENQLEFYGARGSGGKAVDEAKALFLHNYGDAVEVAPDILAAGTLSGGYVTFAQYRFEGSRVVARGRAANLAHAREIVGILKTLAPGGQQMELLAGDYIPVADEAARQAGEALAESIGSMLDPAMLLTGQLSNPQQVELPGRKGREGAAPLSASVMVGMLAKTDRFPADSSMSVKAESPDRALRAGIGEDGATCEVEFVLPIGSRDDQMDLAMLVMSRSPNLPDCQEAAGIMAALDVDALSRRPAMVRAASMAPHVGKYARVMPQGEGLFAVSGGGQSGLLRADGTVVMMREAEGIMAAGGHWQIRQGGRWGLVDASGRDVLPAEYEEIAAFEHFFDANPDLLLVTGDGKTGVFDARRERFVADVSYDEIRPMAAWNAMRLHDGDAFRLVDGDGQTILPGEFSEFIIGEPARAKASPNDFIALKRADGDWVFHTRKPQPLLAGEFRDVRLETGPVDRIFHLTRADGTAVVIDSFLEPVR